MNTNKLPETDDEIEEFIRQCESGEIPEPPPFNSSKLLARMCVMKDRIDKLESKLAGANSRIAMQEISLSQWRKADERGQEEFNAEQADKERALKKCDEMSDKITELENECTRLHKLWSDAYHENECARVTMCKYGAAFAAETLSGVIVRTIEVLDSYRQNVRPLAPADNQTPTPNGQP